MTVYTNDPIRIKITMDDLWNLTTTHEKGIDSCAYSVPETNDSEFYIKFICSDLNPHDPREEKYKDDIEREISKFKVLQDNVREFSAHRRFNPVPSIIKETILDEKIFSKENRYDILLDTATNVHIIPKTGKLFGTIETV